MPVNVVTVRVAGEGGADQAAGADGRVDQEAPEADAPEDVIHANAGSTNACDDYAHRGDALATMSFYVYRMYVKRVARPSPTKMKCGTLFPFEPHYDLASQYVQEVLLCKINVPTLDGINASVRDQDPEQNSLLKAILFSPWACKVGNRESIHHHQAEFTLEPGLAYSVSFPGPRRENANYTPAWGPRWARPGGGVYLPASQKGPDEVRQRLRLRWSSAASFGSQASVQWCSSACCGAWRRWAARLVLRPAATRSRPLHLRARLAPPLQRDCRPRRAGGCEV